MSGRNINYKVSKESGRFNMQTSYSNPRETLYAAIECSRLLRLENGSEIELLMSRKQVDSVEANVRLA